MREAKGAGFGKAGEGDRRLGGIGETGMKIRKVMKE
jgi:hypothetical protein